jgi:hypothetical protein
MRLPNLHLALRLRDRPVLLRLQSAGRPAGWRGDARAVAAVDRNQSRIQPLA